VALLPAQSHSERGGEKGPPYPHSSGKMEGEMVGGKDRLGILLNIYLKGEARKKAEVGYGCSFCIFWKEREGSVNPAICNSHHPQHGKGLRSGEKKGGENVRSWHISVTPRKKKKGRGVKFTVLNHALAEKKEKEREEKKVKGRKKFRAPLKPTSKGKGRRKIV